MWWIAHPEAAVVQCIDEGIHQRGAKLKCQDRPLRVTHTQYPLPAPLLPFTQTLRGFQRGASSLKQPDKTSLIRTARPSSSLIGHNESFFWCKQPCQYERSQKNEMLFSHTDRLTNECYIDYMFFFNIYNSTETAAQYSTQGDMD